MKMWVTVALVAALCLGVAWAADEEQPAPVTKDDVLLSVTVPNIAAALENLRGFIAAIEPNVPDVITPQFAKLLHSDGLIGVQQNAPLGVVLLNPKKFAAAEGGKSMPAALVIPAVTAQDYFNSVELMLPRRDDKEGVKVFAEEQRKFDFAKFRDAAPEEREDREKFMTVTEVEHYFVPAADNQVVYGRDLGVVKGVADLLKAGDLAVKPAGAVDSIARLDVDVARVLGTFEQEINQFTQMLPMMVAARGNETMGGVPPQVQAKLLQLEVEGLLAASKQFQAVSLELGADKDRLRLSTVIAPVADTVASQFLAAQVVDKPRSYVDGLPENCVAAFAGEVKQMELLTEPFMGFMGGIMKGLEEGGEEGLGLSEEMMKLMGDSIGMYEGVVAFGIPASKQAGLSFVFLGEMKDPAQAKAIMQKMFAADSPFLKMYEKMNMKMKSLPGAETYKDVPIDRMEFTLEGLPEEAKQMIEKMYGGMMYEMAIVNNRLLGAFGKNSSALMRNMIDVAKGDAKGLSESALYQQAVADLPPKRIGEGFLSVAELVNMISRMGMPGMRPMDVVATKPISLSVEVDKDVLKTEAFVPSAEIKSVYTSFMQAMAGAAGGPAMGPGDTQPMPPMTE